MALFQDSGQDQDRRNEEATTIARRLSGLWKADQFLIERLDARSRIFLVDELARLSRFGALRYQSAKMLFWLRDIKEKFDE